MVKSEKELYHDTLLGIYPDLDTQKLLWSEDLVRFRVLVYNQDLHEIKDFGKKRYYTKARRLVYINPNVPDLLKHTSIHTNNKAGEAYISAGALKKIWPYIKKSIANGIRLHIDIGDPVCIKAPEDLLDLSLLDKDGKRAVLKDYKIIYRSCKYNEEEQRALGKRQSLLDNQKNRYFFAENEGIYHDKDCELVIKISPVQFQGAVEPPKKRKRCKRCSRIMDIRKACYPQVKIIPECDRLLRAGGITDDEIAHYVNDKGVRFRIDEPGELTVFCSEDTWIIKGIDQGDMELWHNNYTMISPTERYICGGFHNQGQDGRDMKYMMKYISGYTFSGHLAWAEKKRQKQDAESVVDESFITPPVEEACSPVDRNNKGLLATISGWIKRFLLDR